MAYRSARSLADFGRRRRARPPSDPPAAERHWTPTPGAAWGPVAQLSPRLRMQAAAGFRAAATQLGPGLFLVAEVPEGSAAPEFGLAPMLGPLMLMAAQRALNPMSMMQQRTAPSGTPWRSAPAAPVGPTLPAPQQLPMPQPSPGAQPGLLPWMQSLAPSFQPQPSPAAQLGWAHPHDLAQLGCGTSTCWRQR